MQNINLFLELLLVLIAILASNGILYSLKFLNKNKKNKKNYFKIVYLKINKTGKDVLTPMVLISSNPIWINWLETSSSDTLSINSLETSSSDTLNIDSLETTIPQVPQNLFDLHLWENLRINDWNRLSNLEGVRPVDSLTVLNSNTLEQWREIVRDLLELSIGSPATLIQQVKFEELNILYSQDIINFGITQTELRLIIEHIQTMSLFDPTINHFILIIMSYYHF